MSTSGALTESEQTLYDMLCELYKITAPDIHFYHEWRDFLRGIPDSDDLGVVLPLMRLLYPDEHYWTDYLWGLHTETTAPRMSRLKSSADCGNSYAAYEYAVEYRQLADDDNTSEDERVPILKQYFKVAADAGHPYGIIEYIEMCTHNDLDAYLGRMADDAARHVYIRELLKYVPALLEVHEAECALQISSIYSVASRYNYPVPSGALPWRVLNAACAFDYDMQDEGNSIDYVGAGIDLVKYCKELHATNLRLQTLQSMSLDDVCRSVVGEYV